MKKDVFFIALLLCIQTSNAASIEASTKGSIGKKSAGCKGLGLCLPDNQAEGVLTFTLKYDNTERKLLVILDEREVAEKQSSAIDFLIGAKTFVIDEEVSLPVRAVSLFGQKVKTIPKGSYPIQLQNGKLIITIFVHTDEAKH